MAKKPFLKAHLNDIRQREKIIRLKEQQSLTSEEYELRIVHCIVIQAYTIFQMTETVI